MEAMAKEPMLHTRVTASDEQQYVDPAIRMQLPTKVRVPFAAMWALVAAVGYGGYWIGQDRASVIGRIDKLESAITETNRLLASINSKMDRSTARRDLQLSVVDKRLRRVEMRQLGVHVPVSADEGRDLFVDTGSILIPPAVAPTSPVTIDSDSGGSE